ncbi:acetolactate decarboxylase [Dactylosporangium sp. CA-092794]|uniref:acetolactate decarboxylase n=1 Tax=Dactylosporangium sp. CA-092794 TaxID=3239929 RepID=UPI003D8A4490
MTDPAAERIGRFAREVYQSSTMGALLGGVYDGIVTIDELLRHGDFGLGTFNRLDGEMVILDGICHHLRADGSAAIADGDDRTPFAAVTRFRPDLAFAAPARADRAALTGAIDARLPTENLIYAIRVDGVFDAVHTRTVAAQTPPYPPLVEATRRQAEATLTGVAGTLAGFRMPRYEQGISVAGYHLHFLAADRRHGGHALDFRLSHGDVQVSESTDLHLSLQASPEFLRADLSPAGMAEQIRTAEGS